MPLKSLSILLLLITAISCTKNDAQFADGTAMNYTNAIQLKQGDYWIYDNGDSVWIAGDTTIRNQVYHIRHSSKYAPEYLRDSGGYIINSYNQRVFSATDFKDTLWKVSRYYYAKMFSPDSVIKVPAGSFKSVAYKITGGFPGVAEVYYANYIGIIRTVRLSGGIGFYVPENLVRYKIK